MGWHLPGFDTSSWALRDLSEGLPNATAGVGFFVTTFNLSIPDGFDVPMSFVFDNTSQPYRSQLYVNGWMMGKRVSNLGYACFIYHSSRADSKVQAPVSVPCPARYLGLQWYKVRPLALP
jgi:hypothetical protein